jgi:5,10-methylene-tetrahydrofolate dehydrogenase/methenyl tetrahydrofolate cyclohydrolase
MHGDLDIEEIMQSGKIKELSYTPVPGGIGRVTTSILLRNIIKAAKKEQQGRWTGIVSLQEMM